MDYLADDVIKGSVLWVPLPLAHIQFWMTGLVQGPPWIELCVKPCRRKSPVDQQHLDNTLCSSRMTLHRLRVYFAHAKYKPGRNDRCAYVTKDILIV